MGPMDVGQVPCVALMELAAAQVILILQRRSLPVVVAMVAKVALLAEALVAPAVVAAAPILGLAAMVEMAAM